MESKKMNLTKQFNLIYVLALSLILIGCAGKTGHSFLEEKSPQEIQAVLVEGKTTREETKSKFGEPKDIDFDTNNCEIWKYEFIRSEAKGVNYVPIANLFVSGTNDTTKRLKIVFNQQGILTRYAMTNSAGETKVGAFQ
jgi:hypothetical protein